MSRWESLAICADALCNSSQQMSKPDIQKRLVAHVEAMQEAQRLAKLGLELVKAGKMDEAREAHRKAEQWLERAKELEI